jgi:hypothetical protein
MAVHPRRQTWNFILARYFQSIVEYYLHLFIKIMWQVWASYTVQNCRVSSKRWRNVPQHPVFISSHDYHIWILYANT